METPRIAGMMTDFSEYTTTLGAVASALDSLDSLQEEADEQEKTYWGREDVCTYDEGYITQPVYACKKCSIGGLLKGVCYGCSMTCHLEHAREVIELFSKRGFRCDCPTMHSTTSKCCLHEAANIENKDNKYNHNFEGLYCFCNEPYLPNQEMIQCVSCQDWFHDNCLKNTVAADVDVSFLIESDTELICKNCVVKFNFLFTKYPQLEYQINNQNNTGERNELKLSNEIVSNEAKLDDKSAELALKEGNVCLVKGIEVGDASRSIFFMKKWRQKICKCDVCKTKYRYAGIESFLDEVDESFSEDGSESEENIDGTTIECDNQGTTFYDQLLESKDIETQSKYFDGYNTLKDKFGDFIRNFEQQENGRPVTKRDIDEFFKSISKEEEDEKDAKRRKLFY